MNCKMCKGPKTIHKSVILRQHLGGNGPPAAPMINGYFQSPKKMKPIRSVSCSTPKGKHLSVPRPVPGCGNGGNTRTANGAGPSRKDPNQKQPTIDSAEIDKSLLRDKRAMFYKTSMSDKGVDIVDVDFPGCCPLIRVFKKSF